MLRALSALGLLAVLLSPSAAEAHDHDYGPPQAIVRPIPSQYLHPWYRVPPPGIVGFPADSLYDPPLLPPIPSPLLPGVHLNLDHYPSYNYYAPPPPPHWYWH